MSSISTKELVFGNGDSLSHVFYFFYNKKYVVESEWVDSRDDGSGNLHDQHEDDDKEFHEDIGLHARH